MENNEKMLARVIKAFAFKRKVELINTEADELMEEFHTIESFSLMVTDEKDRETVLNRMDSINNRMTEISDEMDILKEETKTISAQAELEEIINKICKN